MKNRKRSFRNSRRRKGFTLTEVLLVLAILVMIGGMAVVGFMQAQGRATRNIVLTEIKTIESACTQYKLQLNRYPAKLDDLYTLPQGVSQAQWGGPYLTEGNGKDPWGNPYQYSADELTHVVKISSAGPDGQPGNADDVPEQQGQ